MGTDHFASNVLFSNLTITFGKPEVIQNDESGTIAVLVTRLGD